jgi:hypothetical protein
MNSNQKLYSKVKSFILDTRFTPVILLLLCFLSYGIFISVTGFFIDDWYIIWFKHFFGAAQLPLYFGVDVPFQGYFYPLASFLLAGSESPIVWGLFALILRWLSTLALWGMLKTLWPKFDERNIMIVLLAAVFPGFTQHWYVIIYSYCYACLAFFFLSITLMIKAVKEPKRFWIFYLLSLFLGFYSMASEIFFGLELIRPVILYIVLLRKNLPFGKIIKSVLSYWSGYVIYFAGYAIWKIFFFTSAIHKLTIINSLLQQPLDTIFSTFRAIYQSVVDSVVNSWTNPFNLSNYPEKGIISIFIPLVIVAVFIGLYVWLLLSLKKDKLAENKDISSWRKEMLLVSISSLVFAIIPIWAAGLRIDYLGIDNRHLLAFLFGSCLFLVVISDSLLFWTKRGVIVISLLVAFATGYQIANANAFKNLWIQQTRLFWQFNWRIPGLQPGTTLFMSIGPSNVDQYSGETLSAQVNWTYSDTVVDRKTNFQVIILERDERNLISSFAPNTLIQVDFRSYRFLGNTSQSIFLFLNNPGCLRILDQTITPPETVIPDFNNHVLKSVFTASSMLNNLALIKNQGDVQNHPPLQILGKEIPHTWCYYFEKAELARQFSDYSKVISLLDEAKAQGFSPSVESEWYPFIDSYARKGDWENAELITRNLAANNDPTIQLGLCHIWQRLANDLTDPTSTRLTSEMIKSTLNCSNK